MISESESYQRQLVGCTAVPNGDELRRIVRSVRTNASDDASPTEYVLAGWKAAMLAASTAPQPAPAPMSRNQIREVFMAHGFTIKEGQTDLKQYVYDAAYALLGTKPAPLSDDAKDAARYRWLRDTSNADDPSHMIALHIRDEQNDASLSGIDAAIDAALAAQGENT